MATALTVNDIVMVRIYAQSQKQVSINTIHYRVDTITGGVVNDQDVADATGTSNATLMPQWMSNQSAFIGTRCQIIAPTKRRFVSSVVGAGPGLEVSDPLPSQVAAIVDKLTDTVTVGARGRLFLPFFAESKNDASGQPNAGAIANINSFCNLFLAPRNIVTGGGAVALLTPIIRSKVATPNKAVTAFKVSANWGTHKTRSPINKPDNFGP